MERRGGKRAGAGRKKLGVNALRAQAEQVVRWSGETPAEFFCRVMQDPETPLAAKLDAAKAGAPYVHRKQPEAHEVTANLPTAIAIITPLTK